MRAGLDLNRIYIDYDLLIIYLKDEISLSLCDAGYNSVSQIKLKLLNDVQYLDILKIKTKKCVGSYVLERLEVEMSTSTSTSQSQLIPTPKILLRPPHTENENDKNDTPSKIKRKISNTETQSPIKLISQIQQYSQRFNEQGREICTEESSEESREQGRETDTKIHNEIPKSFEISKALLSNLRPIIIQKKAERRHSNSNTNYTSFFELINEEQEDRKEIKINIDQAEKAEKITSNMIDKMEQQTEKDKERKRTLGQIPEI